LRQFRARGGSVETIRRTKFWIPELGIVETRSPRTLDEADKAVLTLDCGLVSAVAEYQHFRIR
jgi:hypothetical protein